MVLECIWKCLRVLPCVREYSSVPECQSVSKECLRASVSRLCMNVSKCVQVCKKQEGLQVSESVCVMMFHGVSRVCQRVRLCPSLSVRSVQCVPTDGDRRSVGVQYFPSAARCAPSLPLPLHVCRAGQTGSSTTCGPPAAVTPPMPCGAAWQKTNLFSYQQSWCTGLSILLCFEVRSDPAMATRLGSARLGSARYSLSAVSDCLCLLDICVALARSARALDRSG